MCRRLPPAPDHRLPPADAARNLLEPAGGVRRRADARLCPVAHPAVGRRGGSPVIDHAWLVSHLTLLRLALFVCAAAYWCLGYHWMRPRGRQLPAAIMAAWVQFSLGLLL